MKTSLGKNLMLLFARDLRNIASEWTWSICKKKMQKHKRFLIKGGTYKWVKSLSPLKAYLDVVSSLLLSMNLWINHKQKYQSVIILDY